jgi:hypothetical protein
MTWDKRFARVDRLIDRELRKDYPSTDEIRALCNIRHDLTDAKDHEDHAQYRSNALTDALVEELDLLRALVFHTAQISVRVCQSDTAVE